VIVVDTSVFVAARLGAGDTGALPSRATAMTSLIIDLPDEKLQRLQALACERGTDVAHLIDQMSSILLAEADAETRFRLRAARGTDREDRGLELLRKAARQGRDG
jgi:hypothetical protein